MAGTLLAFLVVFRSQIAWGMYTEGRAHAGVLVGTSRSLAIEVCPPQPVKARPEPDHRYN